jgi:hypothetical protein
MYTFIWGAGTTTPTTATTKTTTRVENGKTRDVFSVYGVCCEFMLCEN